MKVWYHEGWDAYYPGPESPFWGDEWDDEGLVEVEVEREEIIVDGGSDDPDMHAGRWETSWYEEGFEHSIMNKFPWPYGKYRITIEPIVEERD